MYLYGKNVVKELLNENKRIQKAYIYKKFHDENLISELKKRNIQIQYLEKKDLDQLANGVHQGIIVLVADYKYIDIQDIIGKENSFIVILDHLEDPHNFGAIIRTCEAAGVDGIIIPKNRSVIVNSTVAKVSVGALERMPIAQVTNISQTINFLKKQGFWIIGTDMQGTCYDELDYHGKIAIIIGNEGSGMSRIVKESCDFIATIPMIGKINSLNASVSAGIIIYEAVKSRK